MNPPSATDMRQDLGVNVSADLLLDQFHTEAAGIGCSWWETETAGLLLGFASARPVVAVFMAIAELPREGDDPDVIVGGTTANAAFAVAQEWIDARIGATEVAGWLRAGCWKPTAARAMTDAGLRPGRLLDDEGRPLHWVEVDTPDGQPLPVARAVVEEFVPVEAAAPLVIHRAP